MNDKGENYEWKIIGERTMLGADQNGLRNELTGPELKRTPLIEESVRSCGTLQRISSSLIRRV